MRVQGTEHWQGSKPRDASMRQEIIMDIIFEMTGDEITSYNSKIAYEFIGRYIDELEDRVRARFVQDEEEDPYLLYMDIFIDREYVFTVKNICSHEVYCDDTLDSVDIIDYEIYEDEYADADLSDTYSFHV